jgi:glycerol-3-phosphate acyltransferase PlsX
MASALLELGRLRGILRPAIATVIPTTTGFSVLLDAGANVDCKPKHLLQFAIMGHVYAKKLLGKQNPKVGLLNIGEEKEKGNALTSRTFDLLASSSLNFVGNVEGRDIVNGRCDVVVCDGFVGNVVLKFGESLAEMILKELRSVLTKHLLLRFATLISNSPFKDLKRRVDYTEYGGAPLLGVNGVCIISHGNSTSKAIRNAIQVARKFVRRKVNESLERDIALSQQIKE